MGLKSRRKGASGERQCAAYLRTLGFEDARRRMQSDGFRAGEVECLDSLPNVHFEVKYGYASGFGCGTALWHQACDQAAHDCHDREFAVMWREKSCTIWKLTVASPNGVGGAATYAGDQSIQDMLKWLNNGKEGSLIC
jgi:hypothetical protein